MADNQPLSVDQFAAQVKAKYPDYANMDNGDLVNRIVTKYPEYKSQIDFSPNAGLAPPGGNPRNAKMQELQPIDSVMSGRDVPAHSMPGSFEGHPENVGEYIPATAGRATEGAVDMSRGNVKMGLHKEAQAVGNTFAPMTPLMAAGAPLAFLRAGLGGLAGGTALSTGYKALNPQDTAGQQLAGDVGNLAGGFTAASGLPRAFLETPAKELAARAVTPQLLKVVRQPIRASIADALEGMAKKLTSPAEDTTGIADPGEVAASQQISSPYRLSGDQIVNAKTATPKQIIGPERQLKAAPSSDAPADTAPLPFLKARSPQAAQAEIFKKLGVSAPAASAKPLSQMPQSVLTPDPRMSFANANSGESAVVQQLTRQSINDLRGIAMQRGIKVTASDKHVDLINKIADSLTQPEIDAFHQAAIERMQPNYDIPSGQPVGMEQPRVPTGDEDMMDLLARSPAWLKAARAAAAK